MFEKVKTKLFGSRKQGQAAGVNQPLQVSASNNIAAIQRQPWNEVCTTFDTNCVLTID